MPAVVAIMTRSPSDPRIKENLSPRVPAEASRQMLALAFIDDVVARCRRIQDLAIRLAVTPPVEGLRVHRPELPAEMVIAQRGTSAGERRRRLLEDLATSGFTRALILHSDLPDLPAEHLRSALEKLHDGRPSAVIGSSDSGLSLLFGLTIEAGAMPDVFTDVRWHTPDESADLSRACAKAGFEVARLAPWNEINSPEAFDGLAARLRDAPELAPHTAEALRSLGALRTT